MKITDIKAVELKSPGDLQWKEEWAPRTIRSVYVRVLTDEDHEGRCITWLLQPGEFAENLAGLRATLIGRDPHDVEAISYELTDKLEAPNPTASTIDICLWDLLGKHHGEPIYRLLGAARDSIRAYASTVMYPTVEEYVELALECRNEGFNAFKIHAFGVPDKDIDVCRAVRNAVGSSMDLMLDPVNAYDRRGAFQVGKVLEELDFYWYEAPIRDTDLQGLADLTRSFTIPITATESVKGGLRAYPPYLTGHLVDSVRSVGDRMGGITAMRKAAALCEAFNVKYEPHSYGPSSIIAAHLHVMLAIHNCDFVEIPVPQGLLDQGMADTVRVNAAGVVTAPEKAGLGYDVDDDAIDDLTVREL